MGYTKEFIYNACREAATNDIQRFYTSKFINYRGKTSDTNEYYTEVVASWLLDNLDVLNDIPTISRTSGYRVPSHDGVIKNPKSNRKEEIIALEMFQQSDIPGLGRIIDYQTPLKNEFDDHVGKVDLLSFDGDTIRLLELKKPDSEETMLRCVIEGFTYRKTIDTEILLESFKDIVTKDAQVKVNPFVFIDERSVPYLEMKEERPKLKALMNALNCHPLYINDNNGYYTVTEVLK